MKIYKQYLDLFRDFWAFDKAKMDAIKKRRPNQEIIYYQNKADDLANRYFHVTGRPMPEHEKDCL